MDEQPTRRVNNRSGATGVSWDKTHNAWQCRYNHKGTQYWLGYYKNLDYASLVYKNFKKTMEEKTE